MLIKRAIAEGIGTFFLVFIGTGAILFSDAMEFRYSTDIGIGLAFGVAVMLVILAIGKYSGAHINPAVTLGFWYDKQISTSHVLPYIIAQCAGATAASFTLALLDRDHPNFGGTTSNLDAWQIFAIEFFITAVLMFVILRVSKLRGILIPAVTVGGIVALHASAIGPFTGASMNPARSLGPALASGQLDQLGIYICATVLGSLSAAVFYRQLFKPQSDSTTENLTP
ncbi:aquaporin [Mariniblastus sp.]|nr:aquaporin [Mariniblastus sp.]MDA7904427.1 aquaporin [bacterium]MDA7926020.1 aquaporin [Mariniblastus sp.]MDB4368001.1 aquaporin [Mariniblastus sp.]MDB4380270.1 aquaporin [Mariniblastus sp.]